MVYLMISHLISHQEKVWTLFGNKVKTPLVISHELEDQSTDQSPGEILPNLLEANDNYPKDQSPDQSTSKSFCKLILDS